MSVLAWGRGALSSQYSLSYHIILHKHSSNIFFHILTAKQVYYLVQNPHKVNLSVCLINVSFSVIIQTEDGELKVKQIESKS